MQAASSRDRLTALVTELFENKGMTRVITAEEQLVDAGLTSMDMVNLMLAVEAEFDIMIPATEITPQNFRSVASIEALVQRTTAAAAA